MMTLENVQRALYSYKVTLNYAWLSFDSDFTVV